MTVINWNDFPLYIRSGILDESEFRGSFTEASKISLWTAVIDCKYKAFIRCETWTKFLVLPYIIHISFYWGFLEKNQRKSEEFLHKTRQTLPSCL